MAPPKRPWFRFYTEALTDPKLRRLSAEERWLWVVCLGLARRSPVPGWLLVTESIPMEPDDMSEMAGVTAAKVGKGLGKMVDLGLLVHDGDAYRVAKWDERQFESDDVTKRTAKHRSKNDDGTFQERRWNVDGTPPETETDDRSREQKGLSTSDDDKSSVPDVGSSSWNWSIFVRAGEVAAGLRVPAPKNPDAYATRCAVDMQREQGWQLPELLALRPDLVDDAGKLAYLLATDGAGKAIAQAKEWAAVGDDFEPFEARGDEVAR